MFIRLLFIFLFLFPSYAYSVDLSEHRPKAVIELFTSQGCHSCPPADKILADYSKDSDYLVFSWHVDYWNYLGWQDTFSQSSFTDRQKKYSSAFNYPSIYTPQAVINGRDHVVGSRRFDIAHKISNYGPLPLPISLSTDSESLHISASGSELSGTRVSLIHFDRSREVAIERGENAGKTITYHNVVRSHSILRDSLSVSSFDISLSLSDLRLSGSDSCAILFQRIDSRGLLGEIVGAGVLHDLQEYN